MQNPQLLKGDDETSSVATFSEGAQSPRDMVPEHLSTPSPDTSEYNSENDAEGSSAAENEPPADDDEDEDDDNDDVDDDYDDDRDVDMDQADREDSATERMHQVCDCIRYN